MKRNLALSAPVQNKPPLVDSRWNDVDSGFDTEDTDSPACEIFELPAVHIVGICGSIREDSYTKLALQLALDGAAQSRCKVTLVDLKEWQLPFCDGSFDSVPHEELPESVRKWRDLIASATGVILASPEYHGSYSGVLKNALDLLTSSHLKNKTVGIIAVAAGALGGTNTISHLREVARSLGGYAIPDQAALPHVWKHFNATGDITDAPLRDRVLNVGKQVALMSYLRANIRAQHFLQYIEKFSTARSPTSRADSPAVASSASSPSLEKNK